MLLGNKSNEHEAIMEQNSQPQLHLILPKVGDQEYHFCLKTPEEFTKAAEALFDRQSIIKHLPSKRLMMPKITSWTITENTMLLQMHLTLVPQQLGRAGDRNITAQPYEIT